MPRLTHGQIGQLLPDYNHFQRANSWADESCNLFSVLMTTTLKVKQQFRAMSCFVITRTYGVQLKCNNFCDHFGTPNDLKLYVVERD